MSDNRGGRPSSRGRGDSRGRGGFRGGSRGGFRGSSRGGSSGGFRGGSRGSSSGFRGRGDGASRGRGGFRGDSSGGYIKKRTDARYFKGKEGKTDEIKKSLAHRARLRKGYFKLLEQEGESDAPRREAEEEYNDLNSRYHDHEEIDLVPKDRRDRQKQADSNDDDDDDTNDDKPEGAEGEIHRTEHQGEDEANDGGRSARPRPKPMTFQERMQMNKERKAKARQDKIEATKNRINEIKSKRVSRDRKSEIIKNSKTRSGQPLMGPRIENLLEKIKKDVLN